ncbi:MAG: hypothetical protein LBV43_07720 [Prevotella sp.]|jgi:hypothetical protein|nr:hypothetical protein [Prevotella sp.]
MNDLDKILDKYFEGETSLEEERILREYFLQEDIEEQYKSYIPLFNFFSAERKEIPVKPKRKRRIPFYVIASVAASIALVMCIRIFYYLPMQNLDAKSIVYIDGQKKTDIKTINSEALNSIESISDINEDVISSQIDILESFTE